jgi:hypothetical protein
MTRKVYCALKLFRTFAAAAARKRPFVRMRSVMIVARLTLCIAGAAVWPRADEWFDAVVCKQVALEVALLGVGHFAFSTFVRPFASMRVHVHFESLVLPKARRAGGPCALVGPLFGVCTHMCTQLAARRKGTVALVP